MSKLCKKTLQLHSKSFMKMYISNPLRPVGGKYFFVKQDKLIFICSTVLSVLSVLYFVFLNVTILYNCMTCQKITRFNTFEPARLYVNLIQCIIDIFYVHRIRS